MDTQLDDIAAHLTAAAAPRRRALTSRFPFIRRPVIFARCQARRLANALSPSLRLTRRAAPFPHVVARHQSVLRRTLGDSDPVLQERKVINLAKAVARLDGVVIPPGRVFSFWRAVGKPSRRRGFVDGMLLADGRVVEGLGGGLCQLSNFLFWLLQHAPVETVERHHHSVDAFPDSGRVLPFGSGATVLYNFVDLRLRNTGPTPLQLRLWLTDSHLKGQVRAPAAIEGKYRLDERHHCFVRHGEKYFRYNQIWRTTTVRGRITARRRLVTNFAPVIYPLDESALRAAGMTIIEADRLTDQRFQ
jgi:vancomycin resistance protein VanW